VAQWILPYREFWTARLDRLESFFAATRDQEQQQ
jgi:hypothetical protein